MQLVNNYRPVRLARSIKAKSTSQMHWDYGTLKPQKGSWQLQFDDSSIRMLTFTDQELIDNCDDKTDLDINILTSADSHSQVFEIVGRQDDENDEQWSERNPSGWDVGTLTFLENSQSAISAWPSCVTATAGNMEPGLSTRSH